MALPSGFIEVQGRQFPAGFTDQPFRVQATGSFQTAGQKRKAERGVLLPILIAQHPQQNIQP